MSHVYIIIYIFIKPLNQSTTKGFVYGLIQFTGKFYEILKRKNFPTTTWSAQISILWQTFSCDVHKKLLLEKKAPKTNKRSQVEFFLERDNKKEDFKLLPGQMMSNASFTCSPVVLFLVRCQRRKLEDSSST